MASDIIDNVNTRFGDDLKEVLTPGSRLRIAAATFSIYAFDALRSELGTIDELEFLFTQPSFIAEEATDQLEKEHRQFFIPSGLAESTLAGSEFEILLRNKLTQKAIARECAEWIKRKVRFRSNANNRPIPSFTVIDDRVAYRGADGFTAADLGYEQSDAVLQIINKFEDADTTSRYLAWFNQVWNDPKQVKDVTQAVHDHLSTVYRENAPAHIYFVILYNLFTEFLEDISEDVLPNDKTGYLDTKIWKSLYNFQRDAATGIINKLETYNGCILADSVGLGKTFTALAVIKYYELRNKAVLVLCPKKLGENWTNYNANLTTNLFVEDRFNYDVLAHTDLSRDRGESFGLQLDRINWGNYDLVVIDESHNFRNAEFTEERETRYQRLMRKVMREGVKTKVLMLSATPVNNRFNDLKSQLQLAYEGDSEALANQLKLSTSIENVFTEAQRVFTTWSKLPASERTTNRILEMLDFNFFTLLDAVTIARSRKHIRAFYDTSDIGNFPKRLPPISLREPLTDIFEVPSFNEIYTQLSQLKLAVYTPLKYVFASQLYKYEEEKNTGNGKSGGQGNIGMAGREEGLKTLMTVNLLKRLESSVEAFRLTLSRMHISVVETLERIEQHAVKKISTGGDLSSLDFDSFDEDDANLEAMMVSEKVQIDLADMDTASWKADLATDREILDSLLSEMNKITPQNDLKLIKLKTIIREKKQRPINSGNQKVLIFSAFSDTANYIYRELAPELAKAGLETAMITGDTHGAKCTLGKGLTFHQLMAMFSPVSKHRDQIMPDEKREIDVLIGTDVISEGQNLQDCDYLINYDIHWNPVRIIQRFGRIDRIGSKNEVIQLVNFWPDLTLDEYINLKERVENRMVIADLSSTADDNPLSESNADAAFRKEQLQRLQNEVIELEDVRSGVAITDLGLNDFRMDLVDYIRQNGDLNGVPKGLHAVIPANPEKGLVPGVIFALRNVNADELINRTNRLHPHYLVYLDNDGNVVKAHTDPKALLDLLRSGCRSFNEPVDDAVRNFNAITSDGTDMSKYSDLLTSAIHSMVESEAEHAIDSLFTSGPTSALTTQINGLDDFELIAFIAVDESRWVVNGNG